jgi:mono/diheme cytochrome c family protein
MQRTVRRSWLLAAGVALVALLLALRTEARPRAEGDADHDAVDARFASEVRPFLRAYCLGCHAGATPKGDFDLGPFTDADAVAKDLARWELVHDQVDAGAMPPAKAKAQPTDAERQAVLAWIDAARRREARRNAGDPGRVAARRLSHAEYDYSIRDLTGVDIRPTREFPVDPANAAGFDNSAESLTMSPALVKKYLEAARAVSEHLLLTPDGLAFAPYPVVADTDRDKFGVNRILEFYGRQKTDYAAYFLAAWVYRHRAALGKPDATLAGLAAEAGISARYLETVWTLLDDRTETVGPSAALRALFDELPPPGRRGMLAARLGSERMRDFVLDVRGQLVPKVPNLSAPRINPGTQPFVLWKNRQMAANRRRYAGGATKVSPAGLEPGGRAAQALTRPTDVKNVPTYEETFPTFCATFPDAFYVSERARVYLDPKADRDNTGRLLSAGFHSMTGYFRDDAPLSELILDDAGRAELDRLWSEFDFITNAPARQYASYLWFERAESGFLRDADFNFVRAEDPDASSPARMGRLAEAYLAKARRLGAGEEAQQAIADQFGIIGETIRRVERQRAEAEPKHVAALQDLARRAFRRPLSPDEREGIRAFYRDLRERDGLKHEDAVRDALVGILMSPNFLYRVDRPAGGPGVRPLSGYDLASRLSYFLWSSLPDDELLALAATGELERPEILAAQARRMRKDARVRGLATEFGANWLDVRRFESHNGVDRTRFPAFDDALRRAMFEEPIRYLADILKNDRPIGELISGTHTYVNPPLAKHYGIPEPPGGPDDWTRIEEATRFGRGGLLPMAVFLTQNSPGLRTSPVKRGYWVVRRLLGEEIPPPPPNVPELPADEAKLGELTLRQALARHRADPACAGCHERFDGLGLAFEGFGPVGERRALDLGGRPVDAKAEVPRGGTIEGVAGLRAYLETVRMAEFEENICRKLLAYGLGRTLIPADDATVEAMRARLQSDGGRVGGLIEVIVTSPQFRHKRVESPDAE